MKQENNNLSQGYLTEKPFDIQDLLIKFLRRRRIFFYISIPLFLIIFITQLTKPYSPIYRATFELGVSRERPTEGFFSQFRETPAIQVGTVTQRVISNILSVNLAEKIVDSLSLFAIVKDGDTDFRVETKIKQDFDHVIGPYTIRIAQDNFLLSKNGTLVKEGRFNEYLDMEFLEFKIIPLQDISQGRTYQLTFYPRQRISYSLRNSLAIKVLEIDKIEEEPSAGGIPGSGEQASKKLVTAPEMYYYGNLLGILRINVYWGNPKDALNIANVLSHLIIMEDIKEKSLQFIQSRLFIESQLSLYQANLTELEDKIKRFKEEKRIADLKASTQSLISQISTLESKKSQRQIEEKILKDLNSYLTNKENNTEIPNFASSLVSDAVLQNFYSQLLEVEATLRGRLKEYAEGHPKIIEIRARLAGLREQMREEIEKRIPTMKSEIQSIDNQIMILQTKLENVPEDEIQLARLERDRETAEKLYTFFAEKLEETRVQEAGVTADLKIINPAVVSGGPVNSRGRLTNTLLALFLSVLAGGLAVFIAEYVDNTVKDPETIKTKVGLPIYASIPLLEDEKNKTRKFGIRAMIELIYQIPFSVSSKLREILHKEKRTERLRIIDRDISSAEFEAFRKLTLNLEFAHPEKRYRVLYITSPGPEDGKTFVAINLAVSLGVTGKKVVVIDTDFRKKTGHLTDVTKSKKEEGLFDYLKGELAISEAVLAFDPKTQPDSPGDASNGVVKLIPIGAIPPNPFVFLESEKMKDLIEELRKTYDYVIIDGVPLLLFADATYLANTADGVLLTVRYGKTGLREIENAREILDIARTNTIGIIINSVPRSRGSYYYHYYHKYYSKYYKKEAS